MLAMWAKVSIHLSSARLEMGNALPDLALKSMLLYVPLLFFHLIPNANTDQIPLQEIGREWPWKEYYDVKWLNEPVPGTKELALVDNPVLGEADAHYMAGDGRPSERHYSDLVIIVQVPKMADRELAEA